MGSSSADETRVLRSRESEKKPGKHKGSTRRDDAVALPFTRSTAVVIGCGLACSQGWIHVVGLIAGYYRDRAFMGPAIGFGLAGAMIGVAIGCALALLASTRRVPFLFSGSRNRQAGAAFAIELFGLMLLVACNAGGAAGLPGFLLDVALLLGSLAASCGGVVLCRMWLLGLPLWEPQTTAPYLTDISIAFGGATGLLCLMSALLGACVWTPCMVGAVAIVSYMLLMIALEHDGPTEGIDSADVDANAKFDFSPRLFVAGCLIGFISALMLFQFLGSRNGHVGSYALLFGLAGALTAAFALIVVNKVKGSWDPFIACWVAAAAYVVAFYPMNAGSEFSLVFAVTVTLFALGVTAGVVPAAISAFAAQSRRAASTCCFSFGLGASVCIAIAGPIGYFVAFTSIEGTFVLVSAVCSMVVAFAAFVLVLGRPQGSGTENAGAVLAGDTVPVDANAVHTGSDDGQTNFDVACERLASEHCLTPREKEVLMVLVQGYDLSRVQKELRISEGTALTHKRRIYSKLNVHTSGELLDLVHGGGE